MRLTAELREGFLAFFEEKGHLRVPSASLVPRSDDHSSLLTTAGMQPQMPYFLGLEPPPGLLTTTSQKCFRTVDIDQVGHTAPFYFTAALVFLGAMLIAVFVHEPARALRAEQHRDAGDQDTAAYTAKDQTE